MQEFIDQSVDLFRFVRIGIMSGPFDPMQRDPGLLMPGFIIPDT